MNTVFEGNLGNTPELRFTGQGALTQAVTTLRVCSNRRRRLDDGTYESLDELWMNVEVWGRQAESCAKGLRKGAPLLIVGDLRDNSYEKDGKRINAVKLVAQHVALNLTRIDTLRYETRKAANDANGHSGRSDGEARSEVRRTVEPDDVVALADDFVPDATDFDPEEQPF